MKGRHEIPSHCLQEIIRISPSTATFKINVHREGVISYLYSIIL